MHRSHRWLKCRLQEVAHAEAMAARQVHGVFSTTRKTAANRRTGAANATLTAELRCWLVESRQPLSAIAHGLGVAVSRVTLLRSQSIARAGSAPRSIFELARAA